MLKLVKSMDTILQKVLRQFSSVSIVDKVPANSKR